jgi:hypothetical protein
LLPRRAGTLRHERFNGNTLRNTAWHLMKSVTISAKIPAPLKRKIERYRIMVSEIVRTALEKEVLRIEANDLAGRLDRISSQLSPKLRSEDIVLAVRASRQER